MCPEARPQEEKAVNTATRANARLEQVVAALGAVAVLALMTTVLANAVRRLAFGSPIQGSIDYVSAWWMPAILAFGLGLAAVRSEHIQVDVLEGLWGRVEKRLSVWVSSVITLGLLGLLILAGLEEAHLQHGLGETAPAASIPVWPSRYLLVAGLGYYCLVVAVLLWRHARSRATTQPADGTESV